MPSLFERADIFYVKEVLEQALKQYQGTMLFVSHDHSFIEALATRVWELTPQGLHDYQGTYESYLYAKKYQANEANTDKDGSHNGSQPTQSAKPAKEPYALRKELASLETKISRLERDIEGLHSSFFTLEYGTAEYESAAAKLKEKQELLKGLNEQWEAMQQNSD